jgi:hypothetical protein
MLPAHRDAQHAVNDTMLLFIRAAASPGHVSLGEYARILSSSTTKLARFV